MTILLLLKKLFKQDGYEGSPPLYWWQWAIVVGFAVGLQAAVAGWCIGQIVTQNYGYLVASVAIWCMMSLMIYDTVHGDREIFYAKNGKMRSWLEVGCRMALISLYSAVFFWRLVRAHFVRLNKLNEKIHRYDL